MMCLLTVAAVFLNATCGSKNTGELVINLAESYYNRGNAEFELKQYPVAISDYDTAIALNPDYARAYFQRGLAKYLLDRRLEAKQDLHTALELAIKAGDTGLKIEVEDNLRDLFNE